MAEDSKIRSLTNEVIRRMTTTSELLPDEERCMIMDELAQKMWLQTAPNQEGHLGWN